MSRTYTRAEVDRMRRSLQDEPVLHSPNIEERLRTYIIAGVDPADFPEPITDPVARSQKAIADMATSMEYNGPSIFSGSFLRHF